jgi:hypothetical protein
MPFHRKAGSVPDPPAESIAAHLAVATGIAIAIDGLGWIFIR